MRYWPVYGGGETITVTLANEFIRREHNVFVIYTYEKFCSPMPYNVSPDIKSQKIHTIERFNMQDVERVHEYIEMHNIDIAINQWGNTKLCYLAVQNTNCKLVTCWHLDILPKVAAPHSIKERIIKIICGNSIYCKYIHRQQMRSHDNNYRLSDKYVFLSESFLEDYVNLSRMKLNANKLAVIPNPLTYNYVYDFKDYKNKCKQVLFVGRIFEYHKRLSYILKIWKQIESDNRFSDWRLCIVGDGPDMQQTRQLSADLGLMRISFEGFKNPQQYYLSSSIFLMTSAFEGFGMTLVEAQQYGVVPIVMNSYKSLHDIIKNNENGIIIPDNDLEMFVKELKNLILDDKRRRQLAENGSATCKKFSVNTIVPLWENLFRTL